MTHIECEANACSGTALIIVTPLAYIGRVEFFFRPVTDGTTAFSLSVYRWFSVRFLRFTTVFLLHWNWWKTHLYSELLAKPTGCVLLRKVVAFLTTSVAGWIFSPGPSFNYVQVNDRVTVWLTDFVLFSIRIESPTILLIVYRIVAVCLLFNCLYLHTWLHLGKEIYFCRAAELDVKRAIKCARRVEAEKISMTLNELFQICSKKYILLLNII